MIYIMNAKMNGRIFYIQISSKCPTGLSLDRLFVFATTNDQKRSVGLLVENNYRKGGEKDASF